VSTWPYRHHRPPPPTFRANAPEAYRALGNATLAALKLLRLDAALYWNPDGSAVIRATWRKRPVLVPIYGDGAPSRFVPTGAMTEIRAMGGFAAPVWDHITLVGTLEAIGRWMEEIGSGAP
jgi:hypothetical protein